MPVATGNSLKAICSAVIISFFILPVSCAKGRDSVYRKSRIVMDTIVTVSAVAADEKNADTAIGAAFAEIEKLDRLLNFFSDKSELSAINRNAGISAVRVSPETLEVIEKAIYASEHTAGAFDATIGPEISQWDFVKKKRPDDASIKKRLPLVNYRMIKINRKESSVYLEKKGMLLDLGAIAKGFAADKAVDELKKNGIRAGLVAVAGDIRAFGLKPDGKGWIIGIQNPRATNSADEIIATIELKDKAISTSGDYQRFFIINGKRYHHLLDPKTGCPARGCESVSVIADDGVSTDSFSTGVFILGPEKGMAVLKKMGFEGLIISGNGRINTTPGLKDKIEFKRNH